MGSDTASSCDLFPNISFMNSSTGIVFIQDKSQGLIQINGSLSTDISKLWIRALELRTQITFYYSVCLLLLSPLLPFDLGYGCDLEL